MSVGSENHASYHPSWSCVTPDTQSDVRATPRGDLTYQIAEDSFSLASGFFAVSPWTACPNSDGEQFILVGDV